MSLKRRIHLKQRDLGMFLSKFALLKRQKFKIGTLDALVAMCKDRNLNQVSCCTTFHFIM
jgi:hypothetical protein